ncbi:short-chain dehydrogenase/reductase-like protein [Tothia fuscella]|uniref:Short-chain dehydrogenase/reductase-like protein n=1 Tax=Tothia fuscella TaxID=1048955 RepID=A0A9P4TUP3_9PEZI|nr:short-chain dehydrogenase/reductase-like protein [Tothia fuscella]
MPPWALITPASRGIGAALTRRILQTTNVPVIATSRTDQNETKEKLLDGLKDVEESRLTVLKLDVLDESTIEAVASHCHSAFPKKSHHLHLAFTIPGILYPEKSPSQINAKDAVLTFQTNTLGPLLLLKHFNSFLPTKQTSLPSQQDSSTTRTTYKGLNPTLATYAIMSARVGSISDNSLGGWYSYRASKAGVNQIVKTFDNHLKAVARDHAMAVGLHPGTVRTDLSREFWGSVKKDKLFGVDWVAERLVGLCTGGIGVEGRGKCWDFDGKVVPP